MANHASLLGYIRLAAFFGWVLVGLDSSMPPSGGPVWWVVYCVVWFALVFAPGRIATAGAHVRRNRRSTKPFLHA
jgi:hypothetical protein